jgi:hypothetical protein
LAVVAVWARPARNASAPPSFLAVGPSAAAGSFDLFQLSAAGEKAKVLATFPVAAAEVAQDGAFGCGRGYCMMLTQLPAAKQTILRNFSFFSPALLGKVTSLMDVAFDFQLSSTTLPLSEANVRGATPGQYEPVGVRPVPFHWSATIALGAKGEFLGGRWTGDPAEGPELRKITVAANSNTTRLYNYSENSGSSRLPIPPNGQDGPRVLLQRHQIRKRDALHVRRRKLIQFKLALGFPQRVGLVLRPLPLVTYTLDTGDLLVHDVCGANRWR